jgi:orotate phosphoribosyltransferase
MESRTVKIYSKASKKVAIKVMKGHFATNHSHINYYIDMTTLKARQNEAQAAAEVLARQYENTTYVDTIICMEGCEVIGAYLAQALTSAGIMSMNAHQTIYVVSPEEHAGGQLIFRDNMQFMIKGKHILMLFANATTGKTIHRALECVQYYEGNVVGIAAVFSAVSKVHDMEVHSIFTAADIPDYRTYEVSRCPHCQAKEKVDAMVNSYGYSKI